MGSFIDLTGQKFGTRTLVRHEGAGYYTVKCDCGNIQSNVVGSKMIKGKAIRCRECFYKSRETHGMEGSREYSSWRAMLGRCTNKNSPDYPRWGGAGIKVCDRWLRSFENFFADMGPRPERTSIDRWPNPGGDYEPGNCRWATDEEQANNRKKRGPNKVK